MQNINGWRFKIHQQRLINHNQVTARQTAKIQNEIMSI